MLQLGRGNFYDEQLYKPHQTLNFCVTEKNTLVSFRPGWSTIPSADAIPWVSGSVESYRPTIRMKFLRQIKIILKTNQDTFEDRLRSF